MAYQRLNVRPMMLHETTLFDDDQMRLCLRRICGPSQAGDSSFSIFRSRRTAVAVIYALLPPQKPLTENHIEYPSSERRKIDGKL